MSGLLIALILPFGASGFYFSRFVGKSDQCVDFKAGAGLRSGISQFTTTVPRPVSTSGSPYKFRCGGGELTFCTVSQRVNRACPKISMQLERTVWGLIKIPSFKYSLRGCHFGEEGAEVSGDLQGTTEGAEITFRILSVGMRRICDLSSPTIQRNLVFFPEKYFTRVPDHRRSLNFKTVREAIVKTINGNLANSVKSALNSKYDCDIFLESTK